MDEIFKIGEEGTHALVQRQIKNTFKWVALAEAAVCILFISLGGFEAAVLFCIVITFPVLLGFFKKHKYYKVIRYAITSDRFIQFVDTGNADLFVQAVRERNERRYGIKDEKEVLFDNIDKVLFKKSGEIYIYSREYDSFTHSGRIIFYPEMENFERIKSFIQERFAQNIVE